MIDLTDAPVSALLELHGDVLAELRRDYGDTAFN